MIHDKGLEAAIARYCHLVGVEQTSLRRQVVEDTITAYLSASAEPVAWEFFQDESYFGMWCVRPVGSRWFSDSFHVSSQDEAQSLCALLSSRPAPKDAPNV